MTNNKVKIEWRRGISGNQGTFVFNPNPNIKRTTPGKRVATLVVPLLDGAVVQNFATDERTIELAGVLYTKSNNWDEMETLRNNMISGIGRGPGQLHIISNQRHIQYNGQITTEGIQWDSQAHSNIQDYTIRIIVPNTLEINVTETSQTANSNAEII